jgi:hypothetical protein
MLLRLASLCALLLSLAGCGGSGVLTAPAGPLDDDDVAPDDDDLADDDDSAAGPIPLAVVFSVDRGFYYEPFDLVLSTEQEGSTITWTLDGSDPTTSSVAFQSASPATALVDPASELGRDPTPGVVVRAFASRDGSEPGPGQSHTYVFVEQVTALSPHDEPPGPDWPATYDAYGTGDPNQSIDYGMDPRVYEDPAYADLLTDALLDIPSMSISTDLANLFDPDTGIYMNALEHGADWERACSLELLDPADEAEFGVNAGVRIRGGWSRHPDNPKHAFRLFFRGEYGETKLRFPLFGQEGVHRFDKIDLRTSQNYSWSYKGAAGRENTMNRDVFSRDLQREIGRPYTRSRYMHLYLNGVYWGLFQTQERSEARFAASYLGGEPEDYDVIKVNGDIQTARVIEATDGTLDVWEDIWERCQAGFATDAAYQALQGNDPLGEPDPELPVLVDLDNLIDYMLVIFYAGNFDSPTGSFSHNQGPNNFYAVRDRVAGDRGFLFFAHDAEHSLLAESWGPGEGLAEDRVNLGTRADEYRMNVAGFMDFHPQWLHFKLTENADYRVRFAARAAVWLSDDGPMAEPRSSALFRARAEEIELAIVAESARWGDSCSFSDDGRTWRTRDDDWVPALDRVLEDWMPYRTALVIEQLEAAGLWSGESVAP